MDRGDGSSGPLFENGPEEPSPRSTANYSSGIIRMISLNGISIASHSSAR